MWRPPLIALLLCAGAITQAAAQLPAFPGAEGAGRLATGGRGGRVCPVTTLADYDPRARQPRPIEGSLRWAVLQPGPRTVVFRVAGIIELEAPLVIRDPRLTIAGQTAPGDGICLTNHPLVVAANDIVVRHLRIRLGDTIAKEQDAVSVVDGRRVIIDHCSASWSVDETLSVTGEGCGEVTVQWCIISESLDKSRHSKGAHGYGSLVRTDGPVTFHHNLYAHHRSRCPRPGTYGRPPGLTFDFRNNVIYDWIAPAGYTSTDAARINYVGNFLRPGPSTHDADFMFKIGGPQTRMYAEGNLLDTARAAGADDWSLVAGAMPENRLATPLPMAAVTTEPAAEALHNVLAKAGATAPRRDAVDVRIVADVRHARGRVIDRPADVGGWPLYAGGAPPPDEDGDGLPDAWERGRLLDPTQPVDGGEDRDGDGFTNLEEYLDEIAAPRP